MCLIERFGRRSLLLLGAVGMLLPNVVTAILGLAYTRQNGGQMEVLSDTAGQVIVAAVFVFIVNFAYSWGPTTWVSLWPSGTLYPLFWVLGSLMK